MYSNNEYLHTIQNTEKQFIITQLTNIISALDPSTSVIKRLL